MDIPSRGPSKGGPGRGQRRKAPLEWLVKEAEESRLREEAQQRSSRAKPSERSKRADKRRKLKENAEPSERSIRADKRRESKEKVERCISFFREYDKATNMILAQIPGGLERLDRGVKKLGLDSKKRKELGFGTPESMAWMDHNEKLAGIANSPIPDKIDRLENMKNTKRYEYYYKEGITYEEQKTISSTWAYLDNHQKYLHSLKETLQEQYETLGIEVEKYKDQRNALRGLDLSRLQRDLAEMQQRYHTFARSVSPEILELAVKGYKAELDPKVISPLILSRANKLVERASETVFDEKIAEKQELQKRAAEDLRLEGHGCYFFLNSQMHETNYYLKHPDLVILRQGGKVGCGITCTQMVAADKNKAYSRYDKEDMLQVFKRKYPLVQELQEGVAGTFTAMHPPVLQDIGHPIRYEYDHILSILSQKVYDAGFQSHQEYAYMDDHPRYITVDQFKSAIGQKGPIFAYLTRIRKDKEPGTSKHLYTHVILIDAMEEGRIVYRDPYTGQGGAVSWEDFLEVWDGRACIPAEQPSPSLRESRSDR
jgi:hypothetical protein